MAAKSMTKEEVSLFVDLINRYKTIASKQTDASSNREKDECWRLLTEKYNSATLNPRSVKQLKLKWDNLKKSARNRLRTGGGPPDNIPPDDILNKVTAILGTSCTGLPDTYGGDAEPPVDVTIEVISDEEKFDRFRFRPSFGAEASNSEAEEPMQCTSSETFEAPLPRSLRLKGNQRKKDCLSIKKRNEAIANYYTAKEKLFSLKYKILLEKYKNKREKRNKYKTNKCDSE